MLLDEHPRFYALNSIGAGAVVFPSTTLRLPDWLEPFLASRPAAFETGEDRMRLVLEIAHLNIRHKTGGPFAAAIFDGADHRLLAPGVNLVVASGCSIAHAEIMAIVTAERLTGGYTLAAVAGRRFELVSSAAPCAMCLGAVQWCGVASLVCGARDEDVRAIGFDEGHKPADWIRGLEQRGISVSTDVLREAAIACLHDYAHEGGVIYNAQPAGPTNSVSPL
jgi:tRNA(Arg) A34 adenosine deaminase TadA